MRLQTVLIVLVLLLTRKSPAQQVFDSHVHLWEGEKALRQYEAQVKTAGIDLVGLGGMWFGGPLVGSSNRMLEVLAQIPSCQSSRRICKVEFLLPRVKTLRCPRKLRHAAPITGKVFGSRAGTVAKPLTLLLTTVWFAAVHYPDQGLAGVEQAAVTGLAFGTIFLMTGSLFIPMLAHAAFDLAAIAIIYCDLETRVAHLLFR